LSINIEDIVSRANENFEEQNQVMEHSIIIVNCCVIIINAHYNYTV
jgi:hypothetical protein